MKPNQNKDSNLAIEATRLVSCGYEVVKQTGECRWEEVLGTFETMELAQESMDEYPDKSERLWIAQFFIANH